MRFGTMWQRPDNKVAVMVFLDHLSEDLGEVKKPLCDKRSRVTFSQASVSFISIPHWAGTHIHPKSNLSLFTLTNLCNSPSLPPKASPVTKNSQSRLHHRHVIRCDPSMMHLEEAVEREPDCYTKLPASPSKCPTRSRSYRVRRGSHQNAIE